MIGFNGGETTTSVRGGIWFLYAVYYIRIDGRTDDGVGTSVRVRARTGKAAQVNV